MNNELKWTITAGPRRHSRATCGSLLKGNITISGVADRLKQALALPFR